MCCFWLLRVIKKQSDYINSKFSCKTYKDCNFKIFKARITAATEAFKFDKLHKVVKLICKKTGEDTILLQGQLRLKWS